MEDQQLLVVESAVVPARDYDNGGETSVEIRDIRVSATGVRFRRAAEDAGLYPQLRGILLADGTLWRSDGGGSRWMGEGGRSEWGSDFYWQLPVDLSQVEALCFAETVVPLK